MPWKLRCPIETDIFKRGIFAVNLQFSRFWRYSDPSLPRGTILSHYLMRFQDRKYVLELENELSVHSQFRWSAYANFLIEFSRYSISGNSVAKLKLWLKIFRHKISSRKGICRYWLCIHFTEYSVWRPRNYFFHP